MPSFKQCLLDALEEKDATTGERTYKGFGPKRIAEASDLYDRYHKANINQGQSAMEAGYQAMTQVIDEINARVEAKARAATKNLTVLADAQSRAKQAITAPGSRRVGRRISSALKSFFEDQGNIVGPNIEGMYRSFFKGRYVNAFEDVLSNWSKGAWGKQLGKAHEPNVIRELDGINTGDKSASEIADAFRRVKEMFHRDFNHFGGAVPALRGADLLPDTLGAVQVARTAKHEVMQDLNDAIDWDKQVWPDGRSIDPTEREAFLDAVYEFRRSDGASEPDLELGGGQGSNVGNMLSMNALLRFKNAEAWSKLHQKYGDGTLFDVMARNIDQMAWKASTVSVLGPNPVAMVRTLEGVMAKQADTIEKTGGKNSTALADMRAQEHVIRNMADIALRTNSLDPNSHLATFVGASSNLISAAMLKAAVLVAAPSDLVTTVVTRMANHQPLTGFWGDYFTNLFAQRRSQEWQIQMGIMVDELTSANFAQTRLGIGPTYGFQISRRISDGAMRASGMVRHTNAIRAANAKEMAASLHRQRHTKFADLRNRSMFERAGITEAEWDRVRMEAPEYAPRGNAGKFLRPLDIHGIKGKDAPELAAKFMNMMYNEGRNMVLATSLEATARLKGGLRTNSAAGLTLHSASMFGGFPLTYLMVYSRMFARMDKAMEKGKLVAGLAIGGMFAGMLAIQLKNFIAGKEPLPLDDIKTYFKAGLAGGTFGIFGDAMYSASSSDPSSSFVEGMAGPLTSMIGDAIELTLQEPLIWAGISERTAATGTEYSAKAAKFGFHYIMPQTWYISQVLERDFLSLFDTPAQTRRKIKLARDQGSPFRRGWEPDKGIFTGQ